MAGLNREAGRMKRDIRQSKRRMVIVRIQGRAAGSGVQVKSDRSTNGHFASKGNLARGATG
jgi:hypothetical protein